MSIKKFDTDSLQGSAYITESEINKEEIEELKKAQEEQLKRVNQLDLDQRLREEELAKRIRKLENEWIQILNFNIKTKYSLYTIFFLLFTLFVLFFVK